MMDFPPGATAQRGNRRVDETVRAAAIAEHDIEGLRDDAALRGITDFAARLCDTPMALVSIVKQDHQTFLSRTGFQATETARDVSFCAHAMLGNDIMVVPDATADPRFADNTLVTGTFGGSLLCRRAPEQRRRRTARVALRDRYAPARRADGAAARGPDRAGRRCAHRLADHRAAARARATIADSDGRFRTLADTMPQMVWSTLPDGYHDYYNARWYTFTGAPAGSTDGAGWNGMFHPDDQERAWARWRQSLATGEPYDIEYRLRYHDDSYRWVLGRALPIRDAAGRITRWFGTCTDIHEQKLASEEREVIAQELSHRIKNIFAVVAGLIAFAARANPGFRAIADDLRARVTALGRAHDFVRPHSAQSRPAAAQSSLHGLLGELFLPYQPQSGPRIVVRGDDVEIDDRSATPLALLFHELATNAVKYGALSNDLGTIDLRSRVEADRIVLDWQERGGPAVIAPEQTGFGSQLIELSVVRQLGGTVDKIWGADGLRVAIGIPETALSRG